MGGLRVGIQNGRADYLRIGLEQVFAAHPGLSCNPGGDNDHIGPGGILVAVDPFDHDIAVDNRQGLQEIQRFALRQPFGNVQKDEVSRFPGGQPVSDRGSRLTCTDNSDSVSHGSLSRIGC